MGKVINRKEYDKMLRDAFGTLCQNEHLNARHKAVNIVNNILIDMEIPIPEPSILPDVTPGKWDSKQRNIANRRDEEFPCEVWGYSKEGIKITIGWVRELRDAVAMAGAKELAESVVILFRAFTNTYGTSEARVIFNILEEMGVDVTEFRKDV